mmetsp:Transcript_73158/g.202754  ORF Transcript_73158/g.202754 Transcript_73158/m.202754 type:complete len:213 (+) Transcript_73158:283-921(+)
MLKRSSSLFSRSLSSCPPTAFATALSLPATGVSLPNLAPRRPLATAAPILACNWNLASEATCVSSRRALPSPAASASDSALPAAADDTSLSAAAAGAVALSAPRAKPDESNRAATPYVSMSAAKSDSASRSSTSSSRDALARSSSSSMSTFAPALPERIVTGNGLFIASATRRIKAKVARVRDSSELGSSAGFDAFSVAASANTSRKEAARP